MEDPKEKLVELLDNFNVVDDWYANGEIADMLIAQGVTVHPCEIGQKIWLVFTPKYPANPNDKGRWFIQQDGVQRIIYGAKGVSVETWNMGTIPAKEIGKKLFFTREEAEAHLPQTAEKENDYDICPCTKTDTTEQCRPHPGYE